MKTIKIKFEFWINLTLVFLFIQSLTRLVLLIETRPHPLSVMPVLLSGVLWDFTAWLLVSSPILIICLILKSGWMDWFVRSKLKTIILFVFSFIFTYIGFCEVFFWTEFHSRFNFISVDYLVYTREVLANINESFPMGLITLGVFVLAILFTWLGSKFKLQPLTQNFSARQTYIFLSSVIMTPFLLFFSVHPWLETRENDFRLDQLSRNGVFEFGRAFRANKIDYHLFYPILPDDKASKIYQSKKFPLDNLDISLKGKKPNVVLITVESLGAKFIKELNGDKTATPYLNQLTSQSIFLKQFYATGTRTVRGLEALTLSIPPTPGYAVVKRPEHKNLYSMGNTFAQNGYDPIFLYGGNGFFDNMNSFFSGNSFQVIDQGDFEKNEMTFSNAWGVCDEDLFNKALTVINQRKPQDPPFLLFMLTTSNHRPFTYPEGKIDIPSGTSRLGAVKYTDYAIGQFLNKAIREPWSENTIFIIVADHSTEGRGQFDLELSDYHIPLWIYSPKLIKPQLITKISSQIDLLPSLIHLLGLEDTSPFFGQSFFNTTGSEERAFIGNYQFVGYYKDRIVTALGPNQVIHTYKYIKDDNQQIPLKDDRFVNEAISFYQIASKLLEDGGYNISKRSDVTASYNKRNRHDSPSR